MSPLILKHAPTGDNEDDYDMLADSKVVGRIFVSQAAPQDRQWMWTIAYGHHEDRTPTHGYEPTARRRWRVRQVVEAEISARRREAMGIDGTYGFAYCGNNGLGIGVLLVEGQHVDGCDLAGSRYKGTAVQDGNGNIQLDVQMQIPAGVELVQGTAPQEIPHTREIRWTFPPAFGDGKPQEADFGFGPVTVMMKRIPDAWAAIAKSGFTPQTAARLGRFTIR